MEGKVPASLTAIGYRLSVMGLALKDRQLIAVSTE